MRCVATAADSHCLGGGLTDRPTQVRLRQEAENEAANHGNRESEKQREERRLLQLQLDQVRASIHPHTKSGLRLE